MFVVWQPTKLIVGDDATSAVGVAARACGPTVLVMVGQHSAQASGMLARVEHALRAADCDCALVEGIPANPSTAVVDAAARVARAARANSIVAIGGGSVLDAAKAVAAAVFAGGSMRRFLSGLRGADDHIERALPVFCVPTLAGSGSEANATAVIIDDITGRKLSMTSDLLAPRTSFVEISAIAAAPAQLRASGYLDALCHAVEATLSVRATMVSDAAAQSAIRSLIANVPLALQGDADVEERCWWASIEASYALWQAGSIVTHTLAHPLSARLGMRHGDAVGALEPLVVALVVKRWESVAAQAVRLAEWLGSRARSERGVRAALVDRLSSFAEEIANCVPEKDEGALSALASIDAAMIEQLVEDALASGSRGLANTPGGAPDRAELGEIYQRLSASVRSRSSLPLSALTKP